MFAIIKKGCTPDGLVDYCNNEIEKDARLIDSKDVFTTNNKAMAASFALQAKSNTKVKSFIGHIALAFSPEDKARMNDDFILKVTHDYMQRMGIVDTQYAIYRHYDHDHDHVHIIYNRVNNQGERLTHDQSVPISIAVTQVLTREYGLTFGKDKEKVNRDRLKGIDKIKYRFHDDIKPILREATSWSQFKNMLEEKGYRFIFHHEDDEEEKRIIGISFDDGKYSFRGGRLDRSLTYFSIDRQLNINAAKAEAQQREQEQSWSHSHITDSTSSSGTEPGTTDVEQTQDAAVVQSQGNMSASDNGMLSAIEDVAEGASSAASTVAEVIVGAVDIATTIQPSVGGGGGSSRLNDDDDDEKKKRKGGGYHR